MSNLKIWELGRVVPDEAKKTIGGGRLKGMTDINPMWRIKKLTEIYGPCGIGWYTSNIEERVEVGTGGEVVAVVDLLLRVKDGDKWSEGIFGTGGSLLIAKESSGLRTNDEAFKMAYTDALSVACKALGIGADVYFEKDKTKYYSPPAPDKKALLKKITDFVAADLNLKTIVDQHKRTYDVKSISDLTIEQLESLDKILTA